MTPTMGRRLAATLAVMVGMFAPSRSLGAHPLHTTITELTEDRAHGTVRAVIRVFADDFGTAIARHSRGAGMSDAAAFAYAIARFSFTGGDGRLLAVRPCGIRRAADLVWICLEATARAGLAPLAVRNALLCDLYDDQVNVVQASVGGRRRSLLFTLGDRAKPLG